MVAFYFQFKVDLPLFDTVSIGSRLDVLKIATCSNPVKSAIALFPELNDLKSWR